MKILFLINSLEQGGKERRLVELIRGMADKPEYEFFIFTFSEKIDYPELFDTTVRISWFSKDKNKLTLLYKLYYSLTDLSPDIVHTWDSLSSFYIYLLSYFVKIDYIAGHITTAPADVRKAYGFLVSLFSYFSFKKAKVVLGNSKAGLTSFRAPIDKSKVIYNGYNFDRNKPINEKEIKSKYGLKNNLVITMIASFNFTKDYLTFLSTASQVFEIDGIALNFVCVGKGPLLKTYSNKFNAYPHIIFAGGIQNVEEIISITDIGVLLSNPNTHGEGISNAIMEFMAQGKPVIASIGGGTSEIITNNIDGFLIEPLNVMAFKASLEKYFSLSLQERAVLALNAKEKIKSKFELTNMISQYVNLYSSLK